MADNEFLLRIVGQNVSPQSINVEDLTSVIRGFRTAIASMAADDDDSEDDVLLSLVAIQGLMNGDALGSETLTLAGSPQSLKSAKKLATALSTARYSILPSRAKQSIRHLWETVFSRGWDACELSGNGSHIGHASVSHDVELFPEPMTFRGMTVLYGKCERAGGVYRRTAQIIQLDGKRLTATLKTRELAQQLGHRLYQTVGLKGEAIWSARDKTIIKFRADELTPFTDRDPNSSTERSIVDSFKALSESAGNQWDNVNPDEFVAEQETRLGMKITIDTNMLIWGVKTNATDDARQMIPRCQRFLQWIDDSDHTLVLTSHAVSEYLFGANDEERIRELASLTSKFMIVSYDSDACEIAAYLRSDKKFMQELGALAGKTRTCIKSDIIIVATAKAAKLDRIYSDDPGVDNLSKRCGLSCCHVPTIEQMQPLGNVIPPTPRSIQQLLIPEDEV